MRTLKPMAVPLSEWQEQEARHDHLNRFLKLAAAAVCIVGAASHWQTITSSISTVFQGAPKEVKTAPVSSHRQVFDAEQKTGFSSMRAPAPKENLVPAKVSFLSPSPPPLLSPLFSSSSTSLQDTVSAPKGAFDRINDVSRNAVIGAAKTMTAAAVAVGFHKNSKAYQAQPELEQALLRDHGAQKELAKMIASTYKVPYKTASLIVAKSVVESKKHKIDPFLVLALIGQESSFNKEAQSDYGAQGVMQVVPRFHEKNMKKVGVTDIIEAPVGKQIELGTVVLKEFLGPDQEKPVELALQHYNQGGNAKIDPALKYANGVLSKRAGLTATVANYVQENAPTQHAGLRPNL